MDQRASVGRIVHYVSYGTRGGEFRSKCRAAIVADVDVPGPDGDQNIALAVLNPSGLVFDTVPYADSDRLTGGTWHWPERV